MSPPAPYYTIADGNAELNSSLAPWEDPPSTPQEAETRLLTSVGEGYMDARLLCVSISSGCNIEAVKGYINYFRKDEAEFKSVLEAASPALYFAIARNSPDMVATLLNLGLTSMEVQRF